MKMKEKDIYFVEGGGITLILLIMMVFAEINNLATMCLLVELELDLLYEKKSYHYKKVALLSSSYCFI
jgi:hypothetical protein